MSASVRGQGLKVLVALASFDGTNGASPYSGVTFDAHGNLFGTATYGGANSIGTVWELAKGSGTITPLAFFNGTNGYYPVAGVTFDVHGNLFGTANGGGTNGPPVSARCGSWPRGAAPSPCSPPSTAPTEPILLAA
jgi:uncharacterized repeat protein (TIGR03803 family)